MSETKEFDEAGWIRSMIVLWQVLLIGFICGLVWDIPALIIGFMFYLLPTTPVLLAHLMEYADSSVATKPTR